MYMITTFPPPLSNWFYLQLTCQPPSAPTRYVRGAMTRTLLYNQVSISGQALVFVVRTQDWSLMARAGTLTYVAFILAQVPLVFDYPALGVSTLVCNTLPLQRLSCIFLPSGWFYPYLHLWLRRLLPTALPL